MSKAPPTVAELEAEVARTRERLSRSLARLDRDYALRPLLLRGLRAVQHGHAADTIRRDLLPLGLTGAGLLWLVLRRPDGADLLHRISGGLNQLRHLARQVLVLTAPRDALENQPRETGDDHP
jgi:hypothetical protein